MKNDCNDILIVLTGATALVDFFTAFCGEMTLSSHGFGETGTT
jgi:hypothetical protein